MTTLMAGGTITDLGITLWLQLSFPEVLEEIAQHTDLLPDQQAPLVVANLFGEILFRASGLG